MKDLLKKYIWEVIEEMRDHRVPNQLRNSKDSSKSEKQAEEDSEEVEEVSVVANIAGYTAPLGVSSADVGGKPTKPGQKLKKNKKNFVRWK